MLIYLYYISVRYVQARDWINFKLNITDSLRWQFSLTSSNKNAEKKVRKWKIKVIKIGIVMTENGESMLKKTVL